MEYRSQTTSRVARSLGVLLLTLSASAAEFAISVRHERSLRDHPGILRIDDTGVSYEQVLTAAQQRKQPKRKKPFKLERAHWPYQEIQQLKVSRDKIVLLTYKDRLLFGGIDKEYEFFAMPNQSFEPLFAFLPAKMDQRFVAAYGVESVPQWEMPVKLLGAIRGTEGTLQFLEDSIVFKTSRRGEARTWRLQDIENISTSGPFQFTLTSFERSKSEYSSLRGFNFQLKQRLQQEKFELLWRKLNRERNLPYLLQTLEETKPK